ncbi:hypothetical protein CR513_26434, partial [Mucuna pruriens]
MTYTNLGEEDPKIYEETIKSLDSIDEKEEFNSELDYIISNYTWELVNLPKGSQTIGTLAAIRNLIIQKMDVKIAFINGDLKEKSLNKEIRSSKFEMKDLGEPNSDIEGDILHFFDDDVEFEIIENIECGVSFNTSFRCNDCIKDQLEKNKDETTKSQEFIVDGRNSSTIVNLVFKDAKQSKEVF